jgi:lysozyme
MTILGIDISKWNGNWDADKAKQAGATFVFIKSSQATFTDIKFAANWEKAKDAGLLRGAYHYMDYAKPAVDQANYFADLLQNDPGELPPVVDYEQVRTDNNPSIALGFLRDFLNQMKTRTELYENANIKCPMIYTGQGFWVTYGDQTQPDYWLQFPLWVAHWTTASGPLMPAPWTLWQFWQFTSKGPGEVFGSESLSIDMNRFNGTLNELLEFAGIRNPTGTLVEIYSDLEKRTAALEETITHISTTGTAPDPYLITRVDSLEQQVTNLTRSLAASKSSLDQRVTSLEQRLANGTGNSNGSPTNDTGVYATCTSNAQNIRNGPGTSYSVTGILSKGQKVKVIKRQNGWAQLEDPAGWAYEGYLSFDQNNSTVTTEASSAGNSTPGTYGVCNTSGLNVRSGPGATYAIVGGLTYGQRVKIIDRRNGWAKIEIPSGWCNESYLSFN